MKIMRKRKWLLPLFICAIMSCLALTSCGDDEPDLPKEIDNPFQNEDPSSDVSVTDIINKHTYVSSQYSDYTFTFEISSTVKNELPDAVVEYGIGHGSSTFKEEIAVSVGEQAYYYNSSFNGVTENITFKMPFWFYYVFVNPDQEKWTICEMYYNSYIELNKMGYSNLSSDQKDLYKSVKSYLDECQEEAKNDYRPIVYINVNGKGYKLGSYRIP